MPNTNLTIATVCNDAFCEPAIVMLRSFHQHNSWFEGKIVVIHSQNRCKLSPESQEEIQKRVPYPVEFHNASERSYKKGGEFLKAQNARFQISYLTLEAFGLESPNGVLFLDADLLILRDISELVSQDTFSAISNGQNQENRYFKPFTKTLDRYLNGGVFYVPNPGKEIHSEILKIARSRDWRAADQDSINEYYSNKAVTIFSTTFNAHVKVFDSLEKMQAMNPHILHYLGKHKPWGKTYGSNCRLLFDTWRESAAIFRTIDLLREEIAGGEISVLGNGPSFDLLTSEDIDRIQVTNILRTNYAFTDTKSGIPNDIFGWVCALSEEQIYRGYKKSSMNARYVFSPNPQADRMGVDRINLWSIMKGADPLSRKHIRTKTDRGSLDLPTIGLTALVFAVHLQPSKILLSGIDFFQDGLHSRRMDYSKIDVLGSPYTNNKPHSLKTDLTFFATAVKMMSGNIEVLHNDRVASWVDLAMKADSVERAVEEIMR